MLTEHPLLTWPWAGHWAVRKHKRNWIPGLRSSQSKGEDRCVNRQLQCHSAEDSEGCGMGILHRGLWSREGGREISSRTLWELMTKLHLLFFILRSAEGALDIGPAYTKKQMYSDKELVCQAIAVSSKEMVGSDVLLWRDHPGTCERRAWAMGMKFHWINKEVWQRETHTHPSSSLAKMTNCDSCRVAYLGQAELASCASQMEYLQAVLFSQFIYYSNFYWVFSVHCTLNWSMQGLFLLCIYLFPFIPIPPFSPHHRKPLLYVWCIFFYLQVSLVLCIYF